MSPTLPPRAWCGPCRGPFNAFYAGGLQIFDVNDPPNPSVGAYFVPPMGLKDDDDMAAPVHGIIVEWDRNIIWLFANHGIYAVATSYLGVPLSGLPG